MQVRCSQYCLLLSLCSLRLWQTGRPAAMHGDIRVQGADGGRPGSGSILYVYVCIAFASCAACTGKPPFHCPWMETCPVCKVLHARRQWRWPAGRGPGSRVQWSLPLVRFVGPECGKSIEARTHGSVSCLATARRDYKKSGAAARVLGM